MDFLKQALCLNVLLQNQSIVLLYFKRNAPQTSNDILFHVIMIMESEAKIMSD